MKPTKNDCLECYVVKVTCPCGCGHTFCPDCKTLVDPGNFVQTYGIDISKEVAGNFGIDLKTKEGIEQFKKLVQGAKIIRK